MRPDGLIGASLLALCAVAFIEAGRVASGGHPVVAVAIAAGASLAGFAALMLSRRGRRR